MERITVSGKEVVDVLRRSLQVRAEDYVVLVAAERFRRPFIILVSIILSQNTNDKNAIKALEQLVERVGYTVDDVLSHTVKEIAEAIRPAGLHEQKARTIYELARRLKDAGGEEFLDKEDPLKLREWLTSIPGIGPKTADVFLAFYRKAPVFAVDTHAARIAMRWGLVNSKSYDKVSKALLDFFGPHHAEEAHRLLIALGRTYCKARKPRCEECPLRYVCPYARRQSR